MHVARLFVLVGFCWLPTAGLVIAAGEPFRSFDEQIAPLLAERCWSCHGGGETKGGLDLSRQATALAGGESGPALVPGDLNRSQLWERVSNNEMPPKQPLTANEKALLKAWISDGATWGADPIDPFRFTTSRRAGYDWWSLQPVAVSPVPTVKHPAWVRNDIDAYILKKLEIQELVPAEDAAPQVLIRRLYFDLTGLPPTHAELQHWSQQLSTGERRQQETAYAQLVDELLASPRYGERWARHWLDVVRFGESQGFERRGVRMVQLWTGDGVSWDAHEDITGDGYKSHTGEALRVDQPIAGLIRDLRQRGLLESTLVLITTEFGRTPFAQANKGTLSQGRDHHPQGFTNILVGAGLKRGFAYGETDAVGYAAVVNPVTTYDFHATVLHLLGIDHERLTFYHNGIQRRLTNVHGQVIRDVLA